MSGSDHPSWPTLHFGDQYRAKTASLPAIIPAGHPINVHVVTVESEGVIVLEVDPPYTEVRFHPDWFLENYEPTA